MYYGSKGIIELSRYLTLDWWITHDIVFSSFYGFSTGTGTFRSSESDPDTSPDGLYQTNCLYPFAYPSDTDTGNTVVRS